MADGWPKLNQLNYYESLLRSGQPSREPQTSAPTREVSRATRNIPPDPRRTIKTPASKSTQHHPSPSSEYVHHKPSTSIQTNYPTSDAHGPADSRPSSSRHPEPKPSEPRTRRSSFGQLTSPISLNVALPIPYPGWLPPPTKSTDPAVHKSSKSKDRERDRDIRGRERDRPPDAHTSDTLGEVSGDPNDSRRQIIVAAALDRYTNKLLYDSGPLPKSSGYRRRLTEDDVVTLKVNPFFSPLSST